MCPLGQTIRPGRDRMCRGLFLRHLLVGLPAHDQHLRDKSKRNRIVFFYEQCHGQSVIDVRTAIAQRRKNKAGRIAREF